MAGAPMTSVCELIMISKGLSELVVEVERAMGGKRVVGPASV